MNTTEREALIELVRANTYTATDGECGRVADAILAAGFHLTPEEPTPRFSDAGLRSAGNALGAMIPMAARLEYDLKPVPMAQGVIAAFLAVEGSPS